MTDPTEIAANLVAFLQDIPELVASMDGDAGAIAAFQDAYPARNLQQAIHEMPVPGILIAWMSTELAGRGGDQEVWKHRFSLEMRVGEAKADDAEGTARTYPALMRLVLSGEPATLGARNLPMIFQTVHDGCLPMDPPTPTRVQTPEGLEYFEFNILFADKEA